MNVNGLLLFVAESKKDLPDGLAAAKADLQSKFKGGLPALFYGQISWLPVLVQAGLRLQFGRLDASSGEVRAHECAAECARLLLRAAAWWQPLLLLLCVDGDCRLCPASLLQCSQCSTP